MARRKFSIGDRVVANERGPASYAEMAGAIVEIGPGESEYGVKFDASAYLVEYLISAWLDRLSA